MCVFEGLHSDVGGRFGIVVSRFNDLITERLLAGALDTLRRHGVDVEKQVSVAWVPGAVEIPVVVARMARSGNYDAIIALGCVIRGGTPHFEYVAGEVSKGTAQIALATGLPVSFGVLTVDTIDQAIERAGTKMGNKGWEAACAAIEMVNLMRRLEEG